MKPILASLLFLLSVSPMIADTVTGMVQVAGIKWSSGTKVVFTPTNTLRNIGGVAVRSQPAEAIVRTNGWFTTGLVGPMGYKVAVGDTATYPSDVMNIFVPGDGGTYDWLTLTTNSSLLASNNAAFIGRVSTNGTRVGSQLILNFIGSVLATNDSTNGKIDVAISGGGGSGDVTTSQLNTASNALVALMSQLDTYTSNQLYSLIAGGGITAGVATNIAQYFATNSAIITSNTLWSAIAAVGTNPVVLSAGNLISTNKVAIGTNAATAALEVQGTAQVSGNIGTSGNLNATAGSATVGAGGAYRFNGRSAITSSGDGVIGLANNALSAFSFLNFGGAKGISNAADGFRFTDTTALNLTNGLFKNLNVSQPSASSILASTAAGWLTNATIASGLSYGGGALAVDWTQAASVTNDIYLPSITRLDFQRRDPTNGLAVLNDESGLAYRLIGNTNQAQITNGAFKLNFKAVPTNGAAAVYIVGTNRQRVTAIGMKYAVTNDTGSATTPFTILIVQSNSLESAGTMQLGAGFHIPVSNAGVDVQMYTNGVASAISLGTIPFRNYFTDGYLRSLAVVWNGDNTITVQGDGIYGTVTNSRVEAVRGAEGNTGHFTFEQYAVGTNITYQPLWASLWTANAAAWNQLKAAQDQSVNLDGQMFTRISSNALAQIGDQSVPVAGWQWWVSNTSKAMILDSNGYLALARSAKPDSAIRAPLSIYSQAGSSGAQVDLSSTADSQNLGTRLSRDQTNKWFYGMLANNNDFSLYSDNGGGLLARWYDAGGAFYNVGNLTNGGIANFSGSIYATALSSNASPVNALGQDSAGRIYKIALGSSGGSATNLTPWTSDINGAGFQLTNAGNVQSTGTVTAAEFKTTNATASGTITLQATNSTGAISISLPATSTGSNNLIFHFSSITAGDVLKAHSVSGNNVVMTNAVDNNSGGTGSSNLATVTVTNSLRFGETNLIVSSTNNRLLDLSVWTLFKVSLLTNATLTFTNVPASGLQRAQVLIQQDTNGQRTVDWAVAGGLLQTNASLQPTTNANALDLLEVSSSYFPTNLLAWWPQNFQARVAFTNSLASSGGGGGGGAIGYARSGTNSWASSTASKSVSMAVDGTSGRVMLAWLAYYNTATATPSIAFNTSESFTKLAETNCYDNGGTVKLSLWKLENPSATTANATVTFSGANSSDGTMVVALVSNVTTVGSVASWTTGVTNVTAITNTLSSSSGNLVMGGLVYFSGGWNPGSGQTFLNASTNTTGTPYEKISIGSKPGASSSTYWTIGTGSAQAALISVNLQ